MRLNDGSSGAPSAGGRSLYFAPGGFVVHPDIPGIARVAAADGARLRAECFDSVSRPVALERWVDAGECSRYVLAAETRVFWVDPDTGDWQAGRVVGNDGDSYFVRLPNSEFDLRVPGGQLRVRWDHPVTSPVDVLIAGGNETGYFRDARLPLFKDLVAQRGACAGISALLSSSVEVYPHQVWAALTILSDPVQRYLLADEVGLGKTIEAGYVIRQVMIDNPTARVAIVAPDILRRQWRRELTERFFVHDFPRATLRIADHESPEKWARFQGFDLLVVDEAHQLVEVADPAMSPYAQLAAAAHSIPRVLLLSATPVVWHERTYLALLHLLDPNLYRWDDLEGFTRRAENRMALARAVFSMDPTFEQLLPTAVEETSALIPTDPRFRLLADSVLELLDANGDLTDESRRSELTLRVDGLRAHIGETYRLHRRVIRNRRKTVLREPEDGVILPFAVSGRRKPVLLPVDEAMIEAGHDLLIEWQSRVAKDLLDRDDEESAESYGAALGILASRTGGSPADLVDALRWRWKADGGAAKRAGLSAEERATLRAAPLVAGEAELEADLPGGGEARDNAAVARLLQNVARRHHHVVVFCGPGSLAHSLVGLLRTPNGLHIAEHTRTVGSEGCEEQVHSWTESGGVLIADDTAEDGLNLQIADAVVHCRLPLSPNRLEQRLGRVDRYSTTNGRPAVHIIVSSPAGEFTFVGAWTALLMGGFEIFTDSISTLQAGIERVLPRVWRDGVLAGPRGLLDATEGVRTSLAEERRDIDTVDMLDAVYQSTSGLRDIASAVGDLEADWRARRHALTAYAGDGPGGLQLSVQGRSDAVVRFGLGRRTPLMPPRMLRRSGITGSPMNGAFNRSVALRLPETRLFRIGHPLVDLLAAVAEIDDRGQATAYWRHHPSETQGFFGFDLLVEADTSSAIKMTGGEPQAILALRRQADRFLAPFTVRVWTHTAGGVIQDERVTRILDQPYDNRRDRNFNHSRSRFLLDHFGGRIQYARSVRAAEAEARGHALGSAELIARCSEASEVAARSLTIARAQVEARRAAGRLLCDTESMFADVDIAARLTESLRTPTVKVVSVTCCILGRMPVALRAL